MDFFCLKVFKTYCVPFKISFYESLKRVGVLNYVNTSKLELSFQRLLKTKKKVLKLYTRNVQRIINNTKKVSESLHFDLHTFLYASTSFYMYAMKLA